MGAAETVTVVIVQPDRWHPEGHLNFRAVRRALRPHLPLDDHHIVVLPELVGSSLDQARYLDELRQLAGITHAWIVGGSRYSAAPMTNGGVVLDPDGAVVDTYQKRKPYGIEHDHGVLAGDRHAHCRLAGWAATIMICADAWFAELLLDPPTASDLVIIPSFSITRRPPGFARNLWRHLAVARAYEFTTYVVLADWRVGATYHGTPSAGTSGVANPWPSDPDSYFTPAGAVDVSFHPLELAKLNQHREDRQARRFTRS